MVTKYFLYKPHMYDEISNFYQETMVVSVTKSHTKLQEGFGDIHRKCYWPLSETYQDYKMDLSQHYH